MCNASIHVPHRKATATERLVVKRMPFPHMLKGLFSRGKLVCVKQHTRAIIKQVMFIDQAEVRWRDVLVWSGRRNVPVSLVQGTILDYVIFPDGTTCSLSALYDGVKIHIGVPAKGEGMKVLKAAMRQALAMPPEPKPEEEETEEEREEREDEKEPEKD